MTESSGIPLSADKLIFVTDTRRVEIDNLVPSGVESLGQINCGVT